MRDNLTELKLNIGGMTCVHCREKIYEALSATEGVVSADVSFSGGYADIVYDGEVVAPEKLAEIVVNLGYEIKKDGEDGVSAKKLFYPFLIFAVIVALYVPLQYFGVLNYLAPSGLADSTMGFGMIFVTGLITSVHCIAMCGGINLSQCIPKTQEKVKGAKVFIPALFYNLGRIISYTLIGLIFGFAGWLIGGGSSVGISYIFQGVFKLAAGVLMIIMGVNMLGIIPALRRINPSMPKFIARRIGKKRAAAASPFIVGILNGIMPCGPLQSMWLVALASGNPFSGALSMFLFALGTVPLMLGLGSLVAKLGQRFTGAVMCVGSLLVVVLGLAMLSQGGSLTGFAFLSPAVLATFVLALILIGIIFSMPLTSRAVKITSRVTVCCLACVVCASAVVLGGTGIDTSYDYAVSDGQKQTVNSVLQSGSYPNISVAAGIPVVWIIEAPEGSINGCNYKLQIPEYGIEYVFSTGENVIEFTPENKGTYSYSCWMGMIYGTIAVK